MSFKNQNTLPTLSFRSTSNNQNNTPSRQPNHNKHTSTMDHRSSSKHDTRVEIKSTNKGLLLSKPYEPCHSISSTSSKTNGAEREASSSPKLIEIMKQKLSHGAQMIQLGSTPAGAIAGILYVSTERVAFCSDRSLKTYSPTGELLKFQYKVSIPLGKIKGVRESMNTKRLSYNYVEVVTVDDFSFWFLGFENYKKTLRYLHHAIGHECLCNRC
ncbi:unnamed protein product [Lactuca saligna]|uniref:GRAM domain-containing protein n=1 Tax=Lactuca saligna TaxID=75948 RepID=A0AA36DY56_LACSI|nr:unnamed protein product [Lactuca saligna]